MKKKNTTVSPDNRNEILAAETAIAAEAKTHAPRPTKLQVLEAGGRVLATRRAKNNAPILKEICDLVSGLVLTFERIRMNFLVPRLVAYHRGLCEESVQERLQQLLSDDLLHANESWTRGPKDEAWSKWSPTGPKKLSDANLKAMLTGELSLAKEDFNPSIRSLADCVKQVVPDPVRGPSESTRLPLTFTSAVECHAADKVLMFLEGTWPRRDGLGTSSRKSGIEDLVLLTQALTAPKKPKALKPGKKAKPEGALVRLPDFYTRNHTDVTLMISRDEEDEIIREFFRVPYVIEIYQKVQDLIDRLENPGFSKGIADFATNADAESANQNRMSHADTIMALVSSETFVEKVLTVAGSGKTKLLK